MVLRHEQEHIAAHDPLLFVLALFLIALVPWNLPLGWQLRRLRFAIEVDCDARVVKPGLDPAAYGETLLSVGAHRSALPFPGALGAIALIEAASQLERRIKVMLLEKPKHYEWVSGAFLVLTIGLVACTTQLKPPDIHGAPQAQNAAGQIPSFPTSFDRLPGIELYSDQADRPKEGGPTLLNGNVRILVPEARPIHLVSNRATVAGDAQIMEGSVSIDLDQVRITSEKATLTRALDGRRLIQMDSGTWEEIAHP
jgi:hypothetical protein